MYQKCYLCVMKRIFSILFLLWGALPFSVRAQEENVALNDSLSLSADGCISSEAPIVSLWKRPVYGVMPCLSASPITLPAYRAGMLGGWYGGLWDIHKGLNASVEMGVSVGFGKHNPWRGAHFFSSLSALYAYPVNDRLTLAAGVGYTHFTGWGGGSGSLGVFALANYRINERLDLTGFVSHDFGELSNSRMTVGPYIPGYTSPTTTVGAELGIKVGENTKFNVGVSVSKEQKPSFSQDYIERQHRVMMRDE